MSAQPQFDKAWISIEDYLAGEVFSEIKHEYYVGEVVAKSGVSKNHDLNKMNWVSNHYFLGDDVPLESV